MDVSIVPAGQQNRNLHDLEVGVFRAEAFANLLANHEGQCVLSLVAPAHRVAIVSAHCDNLRHIRGALDHIIEATPSWWETDLLFGAVVLADQAVELIDSLASEEAVCALLALPEPQRNAILRGHAVDLAEIRKALDGLDERLDALAMNAVNAA
jgi:hypothetical protein